jgi:hypothetical protein
MMDNNIITTHCDNECYMEIPNNPIFHSHIEHIKCAISLYKTNTTFKKKQN